jgi:nucleotide-binding universal stress UspA family protein
MFERILVPLDGSKLGEAALPHVEELVSKLSPQTKVEITLLQAVSLTHWVIAGESTVPISYTEQELTLIKQKVSEYLNKASENLKKKGAVVNIKVSFGEAAEEIIKAESDTKADLVAMSTHGRSGLTRWAFGSVADKVLQAGSIPIILVRARKA